MRVDSIDPNTAAQLATQISYLELKQLNKKVHSRSISDNNGVRFLEEGNWRGPDIYEVVRSLGLSRMDNKMMLLSLLTRGDIYQILHLLDKQELIYGLRFFSQAKLIALMMQLPKELLIKMLLLIMTPEDLVARMPSRELFNILNSRRLTSRTMVKGFQQMDPKYLHFLLMKIFDQRVDGLRHAEMMHIFFNLKKRHILDGLKKLSWKALTPFVAFFAKQDKSLLEKISPTFIRNMFEEMSKPTLMVMFEALPMDMIIDKFLVHLPDQMLLDVASQIDESTLGEYLISQQPQLLASLAQNAA